MDDEVNVVFGAQLEGALSGINQLKGEITSIGENLGGVMGAFKDLGEVAIAAFAVDKVEAYIDKISELGENIERVEAMTGLGAGEFQTLAFAMKMVGGDSDAVGTSIVRLERNIERARESSGPARAAFEELGVSLNDLHTNTVYQTVEQLADGFHKLKDPIKASADATLIGSRGFAQMLPLLKEGSAGMEEMRKQLDQLNDRLTDAQVKAFADTHKALVAMKAAFEGVSVSVFDKLEPAIDDIIYAFTVLAEFTSWTVNKLRELQTIMGLDLIEACGLFAKAVQDLGAEVGFEINKMIIRWQEFGAILTAIGTGQFSLIADVTKEADDEIAKAAKTATDAIKHQQEAYDRLKKSAEDAAAATIAASNAANKPGTGGGGDTKDKDAAKIAINDIETEQALAKAGLATQLAILQQEQVAHKITKAQEVEQEKQAVDQEYAIDQQALEEKLALYGKESTEYAKTLNQMEVLDAQHTAKIAQLDVKMAQANQAATQQMYKQWMSAFQPIETAFDGMLNGILNGTETLSEAMGKAFANAAISIVESLLKIIAEWLIFEAVTEGQGSWDDFMALQGSGGGFGASLAGKIFGHDVGDYSVPATGIAMIHQGEMIIPAPQAQSIRDGASFGSGGGSNVSVNMNVSAVDAKSFTAFMNQPLILRQLAKNIGGYLNNNPSARPGY